MRVCFVIASLATSDSSVQAAEAAAVDDIAAVDDVIQGRQLSTGAWLKTHPWARPPPPFDAWSGEAVDDYVKAHTPTGVESKLGEQGFTGAAIVELLTAPTTTNAEQLIKEAVPGRPADRLSVLHLLRKVVRPSPPPPPPRPMRPHAST